MKQITLQGAILVSVIAICISSIAIALITHDDCSAIARPRIEAFDRPLPPRGMHGKFERGQGFGGREMGPPMRRNERQGGRRGRRLTE